MGTILLPVESDEISASLIPKEALPRYYTNSAGLNKKDCAAQQLAAREDQRGSLAYAAIAASNPR
jgi:hypothetical protein